MIADLLYARQLSILGVESSAHLVNQRLVFINENKPPNIPHQLIDYLHFRYLSFHSLLLIALLVFF